MSDQNTVPAQPEKEPAPTAPRLLDQVRQVAEAHGYATAARDSFVQWTVRLVHSHGRRHPRELDPTDLGRFIEQVVRSEKDPLPALTEARRALDFLYREVLGVTIGELLLPQPPRLLDQVRQVLRVQH